MASATDTPAHRPLEPAVLELRDGTPWSSRYGDVYFSRGRGPEESLPVCTCPGRAGWTRPPGLPGVYATLAHGSRGLTTAPLAAELLACRMHGDALPLPRDLVEALHPGKANSKFKIQDSKGVAFPLEF